MAVVKGRSGQVRIIGGNWRGRKLPVGNVSGLRPTTDRIKETLFNWLAPYLNGAHCLDLFSGSGGLAFEALSRYATSALLLEKDRGAAHQLENNLATLKCNNGKVIQTDSLRFLQQPAAATVVPFNIVFVDPPFRQGLLRQSCHFLEQYSWLADDALIYIESESELQQLDLPANWRCIKEKTAGQVSYSLWQRH